MRTDGCVAACVHVPIFAWVILTAVMIVTIVVRALVEVVGVLVP